MKLQLNKSVRVDFHWLVRLYSQIIQLIYLPKKKKNPTYPRSGSLVWSNVQCFKDTFGLSLSVVDAFMT